MITIDYGKFMKSIEESAKDKTLAEKRGKWIKSERLDNFYWKMECSECGYSMNLMSGTTYCPNCGARMDEND